MNERLHRLFSLEGKAALITGASGGIGRAQAVALAEAGAAVGVHGTDPAKIAETIRLVEEVGGRAVALPAALGSVETCQKLATDAREALGRLDILINCAGTNRRKTILEVTPEDYDAIVDVNLRSVFFLSQAVCPFLREQGGGKIINIGSMTSYRGLGMLSVYGLTKAAVAQLTKTMAVEWARYNIQVNCLAPGFIQTPLTEVGLFGDPHRRAWIMDRVPAKRPGLPEDLIGATIFLCSPASDFLTGQSMAVDGGFLAGGSWEVLPAEKVDA